MGATSERRLSAWRRPKLVSPLPVPIRSIVRSAANDSLPPPHGLRLPRSCDLINSCMWYSLHRNLAQVTMMREIDDLTDLSHLPE